jgi:hypothetical protein
MWCTNAPPKSELRKKIDGTTDPRNRVEVYDGAGGENAPWRFTFDVGGVYTFKAQEYTRGASAFGGGYQGDPDGAQTETKLSTEYTVTLHVGKRLAIPIGTPTDRANLICWVWDGTIRATSIAVHGEKTPRIDAPSPTAKMAVVMESATVLADLAAFESAAVTDVIGTVSTLVSSYVTAWNAHLANTGGTYHSGAADADNTLPLGLANEPNTGSLAAFVNEALRKMRQHYTNDAVDGAATSGRDSGDYHNESGKKNDNVNMPIVASVSDEDAYIGLAELYRSYIAHAANTTVHNPADTANTLPSTATVLLFEFHKDVLDILADTSPTVPATESSGAMLLIQQVGATEAPL